MSDLVYRQLGKTGLQVSPLGIGGGNSISSADLLYAFERGINYFFFSSDLHHFSYQKSAQALRTLCGQGSSVREKVVLATVTYLNNPDKLLSTIIDQFAELQVDYIDVFHWGWITEENNMLDLLKGAYQLKDKGRVTSIFRQLQEQDRQRMEEAQFINKELLKRGLVRFVGASFHSNAQAQRWMLNMDMLMLRYNMDHRSIEQDIVPFLPMEKRNAPGVVVFNTAHPALRGQKRPDADQLFFPSVQDCYRFALFQPWVDVVLTGPKNRQEIDLALEAVELGPLDEEEQARLLDARAQNRLLTLLH